MSNTQQTVSSRQMDFEIRLEGNLGNQLSSYFDGLAVTHADNETVLTCTVDQAGLFGVLRKVRDLGIPLVSVVRLKGGRS